MNWNEYGMITWWLNLRYYLGICFEGLRETTKIPQKILSPVRDLNQGPPENEVGLLTTRQRLFFFTGVAVGTVHTQMCDRQRSNANGHYRYCSGHMQ
jgi:hypothetical protein